MKNFILAVLILSGAAAAAQEVNMPSAPVWDVPHRTQEIKDKWGMSSPQEAKDLILEFYQQKISYDKLLSKGFSNVTVKIIPKSEIEKPTMTIIDEKKVFSSQECVIANYIYKGEKYRDTICTQEAE